MPLLAEDQKKNLMRLMQFVLIVTARTAMFIGRGANS